MVFSINFSHMIAGDETLLRSAYFFFIGAVQSPCRHRHGPTHDRHGKANRLVSPHQKPDGGVGCSN